MCAAGLWIWLVVTDHKPPYGLLFSEDGELGVALSASQMDSFQTAPKATLVGSQFFEHWIALQIRLDNHASPADARFKAKKRKKLFLLLSGADAWNDDDWRVLRVRLLHLKNPQVAG